MLCSSQSFTSFPILNFNFINFKFFKYFNLIFNFIYLYNKCILYTCNIFNFIIYILIHFLPKIGLHAKYMLISVLFANLNSSSK